MCIENICKNFVKSSHLVIDYNNCNVCNNGLLPNFITKNFVKSTYIIIISQYELFSRIFFSYCIENISTNFVKSSHLIIDYNNVCNNSLLPKCVTKNSVKSTYFITKSQFELFSRIIFQMALKLLSFHAVHMFTFEFLKTPLISRNFLYIFNIVIWSIFSSLIYAACYYLNIFFSFYL